MANNDTFTVTREQMETIIEALWNASCWKQELSRRHPNYINVNAGKIRKFTELEYELRDMLGVPVKL